MALRFTILSMFLALFLICSCRNSPEEAYKELEQRELKSGIRYDSLFAGLYLGMTREDFRTYCLRMHQQRQFQEGGLKGGSWVEYSLGSALGQPAAINFYPEFRNDRILEMRAAVYYTAGQGQFDKKVLLEDVLNMLEQWYGQAFFRIESNDRYKAPLYVSVKGNRRITAYDDGDSYSVSLWFVDLNPR